MSLDQPGSTTALWNIYDATGVRPEWLLPVLSYESSLNPAVQNAAGAPYYGIGQNIESYARTDPGTYMTWPASLQLQNVVLDYFKAVVAKYGKLKSGIQVYQAEFYPASLLTARGLDDVIVSAPSAAYEANRGFDKTGKGSITPRDLGDAVASQAVHPAVQAAIAEAYAKRPWLFQTDPVYGGMTRKQAWTAVAVVAGVGAAYVWVQLEGTPRWVRRLA